MSAAAATSTSPAAGLLAAFTEHSDLLGGGLPYRRRRLDAARAFLDAHPDLDAWMAMPLDVRLVELGRREFAWQLVAFAIVSGRCQADAEFLFAKNFGHSMARWIEGLFPGDVERLRAAAQRLGAGSPGLAVREVLPLAVAFTGRRPSSLTVKDLDALCEAIDTTPRLTEAMRRGRRGQLFRLRRLLFEAGMVDLPAHHRREGGPGTRQARLTAVAAPEVRRTLLAYLDVRATVLRPKTIDKLTSALAIFGEFVCDHDPQLRSIAGLERRHVEAFLTWTSSRTGLGTTRIQRGLRDAVIAAGLVGPDGQPLRVVAHQLRHTWATELANHGMSIQALMTLLGHSSPEMTIRYARLTSPTLKAAYDQAAGKVARRIPLASVGRAATPDRVEWLASEMLKTRVAHGYCSRDLAAEACAYANICETCPNYATATEFAPAIDAQLADIHQLRDDADERGWTSETARHQRVITSLEGHLRRLRAAPTRRTFA